MRNLKKILALVLALVMSLSLMATAGAESFKDVKDDNPYKTAIDVLTELKVVKGYGDGNFQPDGKLNRAEAAVLVYRIATGDVEDKYLDNYTFMQQSKFTDLDGYNWAKGYINYCQNAGIVVGTDATHFAPEKEVTGYQLLVMLLRTLGYGKAGEFTDPKGWELQTAAIAEREKITEHVTTGNFGAAAPRAMVAEILFRGLLTETVTYSQLTSGGYTKGETLGKREFGLEEIEGVVVANEFADLNDTQVLPQGKTQIQVEGEDNVRTLTYGTKITDIGESRLVYTQNTSKVLYIADTGNNTVKEYGEGVDIGSPAKFQKAAEMALDSSTEFYQNFGRSGYWTSDYRIEYIMAYNMTVAQADDFVVNDGNLVKGDEIMDGEGNPTGVFVYTYNKIIPAGTRINWLDYNRLQHIFNRSNGLVDDKDNTTYNNYIGKVFVKTQTAVDISDEISFNTFVKDYLNPIAYDAGWDESVNGDWVKFIDNDGDGNCEYAFLTQYWLDEAVSSYKNKDGDTVIQYNWFDDDDHTYRDDDYTVRYMEDDEAIERDVEVGDIVLAALIDNQYLVSKPDTVTTSATSYDYKTRTIQAANGEPYTQSDIDNETGLQELLASMAPNTEYEMFLDKFGFVRAYRQPGGTKYALVTELYYTNNQNGALQQSWPMTVELTMPDENGKAVTKEYNLANPGTSANPNPLRALNYWYGIQNLAMVSPLQNWLQPAIANLGTSQEVRDTISFANPVAFTAGLWPNNQQLVRNFTTATPLNDSTEFNYGTTDAPVVSYTNVAVVGIDGDNATINGAAQIGRTTNGVPSGYAVNYIQLTTDDVAAGAASYPIAAADAAAKNIYVSADKETEIYIAHNGGVQYFKGYGSMPKLNADTVGSIHAAYAVARNTTTGTGAKNYWVADVIVYEVEKWVDLSATSVSLVYSVASQQWQTQSLGTVTLDTLNSKADPAKVQLTPSVQDWAWGTGSNWWNSWINNFNLRAGTGFGFYELYNETEAVDGLMTAREIKPINSGFAGKNIFAGTVTREIATAPAGYIPVNMTGAVVTVNGDDILKTEALVNIIDGNVYSVTVSGDSTNVVNYNSATAGNLWFNNTQYSQVKANDKIIWVGGGTMGTVPNKANFIVDLGSEDPKAIDLLENYKRWMATPAWLTGDKETAAGGLWDKIVDEQEDAANGVWSVTAVNYVDEAGDAIEDELQNLPTLTTTTIAKSASSAVELEFTNTAGKYAITNVAGPDEENKKPFVYGQDGTWYINNVKSNITLTVTLAEVPEEEEGLITVTLTGTGLPNGEKTYKVASGELAMIPAADVEKAGNDVTLTSVPANLPQSKTTINGSDYYPVGPITETTTVTAAYEASKVQLGFTAGTNADGGTAEIAPAVAGWTGTGTTTKEVSYGTEYTITVSNITDAELYDWSVSKTNANNATVGTPTVTDDGKVTFTVTATGDCDLTLSGVKKQTVQINLTDGGATVAGVASGEVAVGSTVSFTVAPTGDNRIASVQWQIVGSGNDPADVDYDETNGKYTLPAAATAASGVVNIVVTQVSTTAVEVDLALGTATAAPTDTVYYMVKKVGQTDFSGPSEVKADGSTKVNLAIGDQVKFVSDSSVTIAASGNLEIVETTGLEGTSVTVTVKVTGTGTDQTLTASKT